MDRNNKEELSNRGKETGTCLLVVENLDVVRQPDEAARVLRNRLGVEDAVGPEAARPDFVVAGRTEARQTVVKSVAEVVAGRALDAVLLVDVDFRRAMEDVAGRDLGRWPSLGDLR